MTKIVLNDVSFAYTRSSPILSDIDLEINSSEFLGITGPNGSGKTTLTYLLNGLIPQYYQGILQGSITIDNKNTHNYPVSYFAKKVGMVFQNPDFSLFNLSVRDELLFGLNNLGLKNKDKKITDALKAVNMNKYLNSDPQNLSLGEKQKINLASIITLETKYIVLDEPTAMLDHKSAVEIYNIMKKLNIKNKTIITVEHDTDFLWKYAQNILILDKGEIADYGPAKKVLKNTNLLTKIGIKIPKYD